MELYHYTDINGMFNIIKSKQIWLSSTRCMNDKNEGNEFLIQFLETLKWHRDKKSNNNQNYEKEYMTLKSVAQMLITLNQDSYICSFSRDGDSLSQWIKYANNGNGVAIKFNRNCFPPIAKTSFRYKERTRINKALNNEEIANIINIEELQQLRLIQTTYDENHINEIITDIIESKLSIAQKINMLTEKYLKHSNQVKNKYFSEEREIRLVYVNNLSKNNTKNESEYLERLSGMDQRTSKTKLISYFKYNYSGNVDLVNSIDSVTLGPKCEISDFEFKNFLSINKIGTIKLLNSKAPYI